MVSLVIVSHSKVIAEGVKELALQMSQNKINIATAGGLENIENPIGTDPVRIEAAVRSVYSEDGVLILMDLGSAIMSAEIAIEQLPKNMQENILLGAAPLVEGAVVAAAQAMSGSDLETVRAEAQNALFSKAEFLSSKGPKEETKPLPDLIPTDGIKVEIKVPNRWGLHARPAAKLVRMINTFQSKVTISIHKNAFVSAASISQVAGLGAKKDDLLVFNILGSDGIQVKQALLKFAANNFGDSLEEIPITPKKDSKEDWKEKEAGDLKGIPAAEGIAIGKAICIKQEFPKTTRQEVKNVSSEILIFKTAFEQVKIDFENLHSKLKMEKGIEEASIFDFHILLLGDIALEKEVIEFIRNKKVSAAYAWQEKIHQLVEKYQNLDTEYLRERADDIREVGNKVSAKLLGEKTLVINIQEPRILVIDDLGPAQTATLDLRFIKGIITKKGGPTSHSAILAKSFGIPAIAGLGASIVNISNGAQLAFDGSSGEIWLTEKNPEKVNLLQKKKEIAEEHKRKLRETASVKAVTKAGVEYPVLANISSPKEAAIAYNNGADGIGLYRTEFLYMNRESPPTEEEQYLVYKSVCQNMKGLPVTIRTLDVGGDKPIPYLGIEKEKNPFLGLRGIRYCLQNTELFKTQLRAICRVAAEFPVRVMYPMVGVPEEVDEANELLKEVQLALEKEGVLSNKELAVGIMLEVPSTIFCIPALASRVSFFSIGTNDLTQYLLTLDRGNETVAKYRSPFHPAVLEAIQEIIKRSKKAETEIGMCGELAGNPKATKLLVNMGLEKFSMSSPAIPEIKKIINQIE